MQAHSYGLELAGTYRVTPWWKLFGNYTFERIINTEQTTVSRSYEDSTPYNKMTFGTNFKFREGANAGMPFLNGWMLNFLMHYRDAYNFYDENAFTINTFGIKPNIRCDLHVSKSFFGEALEVGFIAQNLTSARHYESSFVEVPQLFFLSVTLRSWPWDILKPESERQKGFINSYQESHGAGK